MDISIQVYKVNDRHPQANEYVYFQSNTGSHCYGAYNGDGTWYDWSDTDRDGEPEMYRDDNVLFWHHPISTEIFELACAMRDAGTAEEEEVIIPANKRLYVGATFSEDDDLPI